MTDAVSASSIEEIGAAAPYNVTTGNGWAGSVAKGVNMGSPTQVLVDYTGGNEIWWLITGNEYFSNSGFFANKVLDADIGDSAAGAAMAKDTYGTLWCMWLFNNASSVVTLGGQEPT